MLSVSASASKNETIIHAKIDNREIKLVYRTWLRTDSIEDGEWFLTDGDCTPEDVSNIIINESSDIHFPPSIFKRYPDTKQFTMTHTHLATIHHTDLSNAISLRKLNVSHNEITNIASYAFDVAPKLTEIDLSFNLLNDLNENVFTSYLIKYLYLHNNQLNRVDPLWFENLLYLRILTLNNNQIHTIDWSMLDYWPTINAIELHSNEITEILNYKQQTTPRSMQTLSLQNNPVQSHDAMWLNVERLNVSYTGTEYCWIQNRMIHVIAKNNLIREIRLDYLMNSADENAIVTLNLANNRIQSLENVTHFHHLDYLDVSNNAIAEIDSSIFEHLMVLKHLNLANNQLKRFDIGMIRLPNLNFLDVSNNEMLTLHLGGIMSQLKTLNLNGNRLQATDSMWNREIINHEYQCLASNSIDCIAEQQQQHHHQSDKLIASNQMDSTETHLNDQILAVIYEQFHIMEKNILLLIDARFNDIDERVKRLEEEMIRITVDNE